MGFLDVLYPDESRPASSYRRTPEQMADHVNSGRPLIFYIAGRPDLVVGSTFKWRFDLTFYIKREATLEEYMINLPANASIELTNYKLAKYAARGINVRFFEVTSD